MNTISPQQLHELHERGEPIHLFDVRTPAEFGAVHAAYAENLPIDSLDAAEVVKRCGGVLEQPVYFICQGGGRGGRACEAMAKAGLTGLVNVAGGTNAWEQAGLPVVRGKQAISLERQVRIAAGSLVLLGAVLGYFVHPYFIGLAAFVGAGLAFSGITNTCGMERVLAKMPWNR